MGAFLAATLIPLAVELPFSMLQKDAQPLPVTIMFYVAEFLITLLSMVLSVGILQLHLSLARKKEMTLGMVFYGFKNHPDRYIIAGLLLIIATLISCIPVITGAVLFFALDKSPAAIAVLVILGIVSTILAVFVQMWYALALYLLLDHPQMKARESLKISRQIMKGNKGRLFYIYLSFIGLQILCLLSLGIGSLWVYPYQSQTLVIFYLDVVGEIPSNIS
jgi:predicted integral membrane protein